MIFFLFVSVIYCVSFDFQNLYPSPERPIPRSGHSFAQFEDISYIWGGYSVVDFQDDLWEFNWTSLSFRQLASDFQAARPYALFFTASAVDRGTGDLFLFGGMNSFDGFQNRLHRYHRNTDSWDIVIPEDQTISPRAGHVMVHSQGHNGLIIYGGFGPKNSRLTAFGDTFMVHLANLTTTNITTTPSPLPRSSAGYFETPDGFYLHGGSPSVEDNQIEFDATVYSDLWYFNKTTLAWSSLSQIGPSLRSQSLCKIEDELIVFNGLLGNKVNPDVFKFSLIAGNWTEFIGNNSVVPRHRSHCLCHLGQCLVYGGTSIIPTQSLTQLNRQEIYTQIAWLNGTILNEGVKAPRAPGLSRLVSNYDDTAMYHFGGAGGGNYYGAFYRIEHSDWRFDLLFDGSLSSNDLPTPRARTLLVATPDGIALIGGYYSEEIYHSSIWFYNEHSENISLIGHMPRGVAEAGGVYVPEIDRVVVFGGIEVSGYVSHLYFLNLRGGVLNDLEQINKTDIWPTPGAFVSVMLYRNRVYTYGGFNPDCSSEFFEFDYKKKRFKSLERSDTPPSCYTNAQIVGDLMVVFSGRNTPIRNRNDFPVSEVVYFDFITQKWMADATAELSPYFERPLFRWDHGTAVFRGNSTIAIYGGTTRELYLNDLYLMKVNIEPIWYLPLWVSVPLLCISLLLIVLLMSLSIFFLIFRKTTVVLYSSLLFCELVLFGAVLCCLSAICYLLPIFLGDYGPVCLGRLILLPVGSSICLGALFLKNFRIWKITKNSYKRMSKREYSALSNSRLLLYCSLLLCVDLTFILCWIILFSVPFFRDNLSLLVRQLGARSVSGYLINEVGNSRVRYCPSESYFWQVFGPLELVYKGSMLLFGLVISILTRNVALRFNESRDLRFSIWTISLIALFCVPCSFFLASSPTLRLIFITTGILVACLACVVSLFGGKTILILRHGSKDPYALDRQISNPMMSEKIVVSSSVNYASSAMNINRNI